MKEKKKECELGKKSKCQRKKRIAVKMPKKERKCYSVGKKEKVKVLFSCFRAPIVLMSVFEAVLH